MLTLDPSLNMIYCAQKNEQFLPSFKQLQKKLVSVMVGENYQRLKNGILSDLQKIKCKAESLRIA